MRRLILPLTLIAFSAILPACSGPAPVGKVNGEPVHIAVTTEPSPPAMGHFAVILTITDDKGQPIDGAAVDVSADHVDMSGMTMGGAATEQGGGKYAITANFSMSGNWVLTVYVRKGEIDFKDEIPLTVN